MGNQLIVTAAIFLLVTVLVSSCGSNNELISTQRFLASPCDSVSVEQLLKSGKSYPAVAVENELEGFITYELLVSNNVIDTVVIIDSYLEKSKKEVVSERMLEVLVKFLKLSLNKNCAYFANGKSTLRVVYKIRGSEFNLPRSQYDLVVERERVITVDHQSSH